MKKSWIRRLAISTDDKDLLGALLLLTACFALAFILPLYLVALSDNVPATAVVSSEEVGRLQSAHFIERLVHSETEIETEKGVFLVRGTFPARKGHLLVLEQREDGARVLCDVAEKVCGRLIFKSDRISQDVVSAAFQQPLHLGTPTPARLGVGKQ